MIRRTPRSPLFPYAALFRSCGGDVPPIGRVSNGQHRARMPLKRISDCSTSLRIPDSDGGVIGSGDDVPPIRRGSNGSHPVREPLHTLQNCSPTLLTAASDSV